MRDNKHIYLDNAATTSLRPEVLDAMLPWMTASHANANALYAKGQKARNALDEARSLIAGCIGAKPSEVIFTSGGTEANNTVLTQIPLALQQKYGRVNAGSHIVTTTFEHHAVLEPIRALKARGFKSTLAKPGKDGVVSAKDFKNCLQGDTVLTSVMLVQNEIGTIQPIKELAMLAHDQGTLIHTDAVQALGKIPVDLAALGVDAASFSAHKVGGPVGVGAIFLKQLTPFKALLLGGGQELGRRSGTQNVAGAVGFAKAVELACSNLAKDNEHIWAMREQLEAGLLALGPRVCLTLPRANISARDAWGAKGVWDTELSHEAACVAGTTRATSAICADSSIGSNVAHILSFMVNDFESQDLILKLSGLGFAVSGGSACSSKTLDPSHVLLALGISKKLSFGALRVSLSRDNTHADIDAFLSALASIIS